MLSIWVVYKHPKDYPQSYVARKFEGEQPTPSIIVADDIEKLRDVLQFQMGLVKLMRRPEDDPVIMETWL